MFDQKYKAEVEALWSRFANRDRGTMIYWTEIEGVMGRGRYDEGGMTIIKRFRRRLLREREIVTLPADSVGIRLLTHEEAAKEIPALRQKRAYRQVNRGLRELDTVNADTLTDHLRGVFNQQTGHLRRQRLEIGRGRRALEKIVGKSQTHPVRQPVLAGV